MTISVQRLAIGLLVLASASAAITHGSQDAPIREASNDDERRAALWQALEKALPKESQRIEAYAENPSMTAVLLRTESKTLRFYLDAGQGKVEEIQHMKVIGMINRITYEKQKDGASWVMWHNGRRECTIGVAGEE